MADHCCASSARATLGTRGKQHEVCGRLRVPRIFNLRADPFERADHEAADYQRWFIDHLFLLVPAQAYVGRFLQTFREFPPRQKPASFSVDQVLQMLGRVAAKTIDAAGTAQMLDGLDLAVHLKRD
jgi:hypothetical protein